LTFQTVLTDEFKNPYNLPTFLAADRRRASIFETSIITSD
jgi:hypothetical protein